MLSAVRAALRSRPHSCWRPIPTRSYHESIPSSRLSKNRSQLLYRKNGTPRSKWIGALNLSCFMILAYISRAKRNTETKTLFVIRLIMHDITHTEYDFSTVQGLVDFLFRFIASDRGDFRECTRDLLIESPQYRERLRRHLEEYLDIVRDSKEDPVKNAHLLHTKVRQIISEMELRILELPTVDAERAFRESPGGRDRYQESRGGGMYEEVG